MDKVAGLGLAIEAGSGECRVLHTIVGGSAHGCGKVDPGDFLLAVLDTERSPDWVETKNLSFDAVKNLIAGPRGSKVSLKLQHGLGDQKDELYYCENLVRAPVQPPASLATSRTNVLPPRSSAAGRQAAAPPTSAQV